MGIFLNSRNNKKKWASVVMFATNGDANDIPTETLESATTECIQQHARILYDCIHLVLTSQNENIRKERFRLAQKEYAVLVRVRKYATKEQKKGINQAISDFLVMEDKYKHPNKLTDKQRHDIRKQNKQDFWDDVAFMGLVDVFMDDIEGKED